MLNKASQSFINEIKTEAAAFMRTQQLDFSPLGKSTNMFTLKLT